MPLNIEEIGAGGAGGGGATIDPATARLALSLTSVAVADSAIVTFHIDDSESSPSSDWLSLNGSKNAVLTAGVYHIVIGVTWPGGLTGTSILTSSVFVFSDTAAMSAIAGNGVSQHVYGEVVPVITTQAVLLQVSQVTSASRTPDSAIAVFTKLA